MYNKFKEKEYTLYALICISSYFAMTLSRYYAPIFWVLGLLLLIESQNTNKQAQKHYKE